MSAPGRAERRHDPERVRRVRRRVEERLRQLARTREGAALILRLAEALGVPID